MVCTVVAYATLVVEWYAHIMRQTDRDSFHGDERAIHARECKDKP